MTAVFHRQWRAFSRSWFFYSFLAAFCLSLGILSVTFHAAYQYANFEYVLSYMTAVFALLLPLLTVSSFYEERKKGAEGFVRALPITAKDLVLGKLLTMLSLLGILSVMLLLIPIFLGLWGNVYYPSAYMATFGFFLFGAAILCIDTFLALILKNHWVALGVTYAVTGGLIGLNYLSAILPASLASFVARYSFFGSFAPFTFGIVDLSAIVWYLSTTALFGFLTVLFAKRIWKE